MVIHPAPKLPRREYARPSDGRSVEARLEEAVGLARTIRLDVAASRIVHVATPRPGSLFGSGAVDSLAGLINENAVGVVIVNSALSPVQQRNLERRWQTKVIDRTALILEIFGERAHTHEGRLQVEVATLTYQRSRLVRSWTHLERQRGGFGFLGGPGESQLEIDRRLIDERVARLKRELEATKRRRSLQRAARRRVPFPVAALVGYTNAGKSTLFNRLTRSTVVADDRLFATLDPTMRRLDLPSGRTVILSDTVGFISDLPTHLVAAFRATLEEVVEADLIVHVRDVHHPDSEAQREDVLGVLAGLGLAEHSDTRLIEALNKIDLLEAGGRASVFGRICDDPPSAAVSALDGEGCDALLALIDRQLNSEIGAVRLDIPLSDGKTLAWVYRHGEVLGRRDDSKLAHLSVRLSAADIARLRHQQRLH